MSVTNMTFLFLFLPIALALYYPAPGRVREAVLLFVSLLFYAIGSLKYLVLFIFAVTVTVMTGRLIDARRDTAGGKLLLAGGIAFNAGLLIYYKYTDFAILTWNRITSAEVQVKNLLLPMGISFFTFKAISYLADVYRQKTVLAENPLRDALYLSFFAQIQAGPLSRYSDLRREDGKWFDTGLFSDGVYRFLTGFSKKILLADVLAHITTEVFSAPADGFSTAFAWLGSVCYSLQLYYDFSGYSDMAIGITEMFGYTCPENFRYPYMTESVTRFWRRWHITLGAWFRDYIYIPLGGSRSSKKGRVYLNLFAVWLLTGIWHGASWNFIVWGLGYFLAIAFERASGLPGRLKTGAGRAVYRVLALLFINFQWVLFRANGLRAGLGFIRRMVFYFPNALADRRVLFLLRDYRFFMIAALVLCFPVVPAVSRRLEKNRTVYALWEGITAVITVISFVLAVSFVVAGQNNPFAYANF